MRALLVRLSVGLIGYLLGFLALAVFAGYAFAAGPQPTPERWVAAFKRGELIALAVVAVLLWRPQPANRLVLGGNGQDGEAMFSVMCAVLTFLPALRRRSGADIILAIPDGPALGSLRAFLQGMTARLRKDRIRVLLQIMPKPFHPVAA